jgi:hypothetical protein
LAVVFFACFQTWRDEYQRANGLQTALSQRPAVPQIQVNVPPAQIVITPAPTGNSPQTPADLTGFLQLDEIHPVINANLLVPGHALSMNVYLRNKGTHPVHGKFSNEALAILDTSAPRIEQQTRLAFTALNKKGQKEATQAKQLGDEVGADQVAYRTATSRPLTQPDIEGIMRGSVRVYLLFWSVWQDSMNHSGKIEGCYWLQPPQSTELSLQTMIWHTCTEPLP